jgi:hypothetical protein
VGSVRDATPPADATNNNDNDELIIVGTSLEGLD